MRAVRSLKPVRYQDQTALRLYTRLVSVWNTRPDGTEAIMLSINRQELKTLRQYQVKGTPKVLRYKYLAIYRLPNSHEEVIVKSPDRPSKRRVFKLPGKGRRKFVRRKLYQVKESTVAKTATKSKKTNKKGKAAPEVDEDELDELEGLEELEDLDEEDVEEEDTDDEEEDEEPAPKRKRRAKKSKSAKKSKKAKVVEEDEEDEDEDEDEDEEEEAPKRKSKSKSKKSSKKSKSTGTKSPGTSTKEMTGGVGTAELAEAASEHADMEITGRDVRVYLRREGIPKDEDHGRYVWPSEKNKAFVKLAKAIATHYGEEE